MNTLKINGDVISVQQDGKVVINRGKRDGVEAGQWYLVYQNGEVLFDPETGKSMGPLELVRGYGTVEEVESREAVLTIEPTYKRISVADWHVRRMAGKPPVRLRRPPELWRQKEPISINIGTLLPPHNGGVRLLQDPTQSLSEEQFLSFSRGVGHESPETILFRKLRKLMEGTENTDESQVRVNPSPQETGMNGSADQNEDISV